MAPTNLGGRPSHAWNSSRNRKLVRLYLLTNITDKDIEQIFKETSDDGFAPKLVILVSELPHLLTLCRKRSIQYQLTLLLPGRKENAHEYRPAQSSQWKIRLGQLKRAKSYQISKYERSHKPMTRTKLSNKGSLVHPGIGLKSSSKHYAEQKHTITPLELSHVASFKWDSPNDLFRSKSDVARPDLSNSGFSDKELVSSK